MKSKTYRAAVLRAFGATSAETEELLAYNENHFDQTFDVGVLDDEPFVRSWEMYEREARSIGAIECLQRHLVQLRYPIERGISRKPDYVAATRHGDPRLPTRGVSFSNPGGMTIILKTTPAGRIPILLVSDREDFVHVVRAITRQNEPANIPDSIGACFVSGYKNWSRFREYRLAQHHRCPTSMAFDEAAIRRRDAASYLDRFIIVSRGPYSNVHADDVGLTATDWLRASLSLRIEHECAHYYTKRCLGAMRTNVLDELVADYMGIVGLCGRFSSDLFMRFMGLSPYSRPAAGGRFESYTPDLSPGAKSILKRILAQAAYALEHHIPPSCDPPLTLEEKGAVLRRLTRYTLEELASASELHVSSRIPAILSERLSADFLHLRAHPK